MFVYRRVSPTSQIRAEVRMKSSSIPWANREAANEVIDLHGLFGDYRSSNDHEFTVLSQSLSPAGPHRSDRKEQRLLELETIVCL